jgi:hypothetical protein
VSTGTTAGSSSTSGLSWTSSSDRYRRRCNASTACFCFNVASIGRGGLFGAQGAAVTDEGYLFARFINAHSTTAMDVYETRASVTLTPAFLANYDVLLVQWLADGFVAAPTGGFAGQGYWAFTGDELAAVASWVAGGGGVIFLTGYDANATAEVGATNPLLAAVSDLAYNADDVLGAVETGNGALCLGNTVPIGNWMSMTTIGAGITFVGASHGHSIKTGPNAVIDNQDPATGAVYAAHEDRGSGGVFAFADDWITYVDQWDPVPEPATYCNYSAGVPSPSDPTSRDVAACVAAQSCPSAQVAYQISGFLANMLAYASRATECGVTVIGGLGR